MLIDSHFHPQLLLETMSPGELITCLKNANAAGVDKFIAISVEPKDQLLLAEFTALHPGTYYSIGRHPFYLADSDDLEDDFRNSLPVHDPKWVAIGEIGLDYSRQPDIEVKNKQKANLRFYLSLAQYHRKPVIIHTRQAERDTIDILKEYEGITGVLHCFTCSMDMAIEAIALGFYLSFSGIITFKQKSVLPLQEIVKSIPSDKLLIETDSPYLTPHPYRSIRPNEPKYVGLVAQEIAILRNTEIELMQKQIRANTIKLFQLND